MTTPSLTADPLATEVCQYALCKYPAAVELQGSCEHEHVTTGRFCRRCASDLLGLSGWQCGDPACANKHECEVRYRQIAGPTVDLDAEYE